MQLKLKILKKIREKPGIPHSKLLSHSHVKAYDFLQAIITLHQEELIETKYQNKKKIYFPKDELA